MKQFIIYIFVILYALSINAQSEFHVFPKNHKDTPGSKLGNGSLKSPWDLQTALNYKSNKVKAGDFIFLHEGIYNGRYVSNLKSDSKKITITAYKNDKVILNGNVDSNKNSVLEINGANIIFKNFEITFLGDFSRNIKDKTFKPITGINHLRGEDCEFINLKVHNIPGVGIGSWKSTGGTKIDGCLIFNNGYIGKQRGHGVGIYVQNMSDKTRLIENNTIFNNYYKGVEVWDAISKASFEYVKNVTLKNNIIFNNGLPSGIHRANLIIASDDNNSINIAKNILVKDNILYHNTDFLNDKNNFGDGVSLTLGYNNNAPVENIEVLNNIIIGKNNALNIVHAKELTFKNNIIYTGYIHFKKTVLSSLKSNLWDFKNNQYYSRRSNAFRVLKDKDYSIDEFKRDFNIEDNSKRKHITGFKLRDELNITKLNPKGRYRVALFNKKGEDVYINFSKKKIKKGTAYKIKNIADESIIARGKVNKSGLVMFPMSNYNKTSNNFGVYYIDFERKRRSFFSRLFNW